MDKNTRTVGRIKEELRQIASVQNEAVYWPEDDCGLIYYQGYIPIWQLARKINAD